MTTMYDSGNVPEIQVHHRLRIAREAANLEQEQLAQLIGVSRNTIGNAEKGKRAARQITINAWALACGVPVSWLMHGVSSNRPPDGDGAATDQPVGGSLHTLRPPVILELRAAG